MTMKPLFPQQEENSTEQPPPVSFLPKPEDLLGSNVDGWGLICDKIKTMISPEEFTSWILPLKPAKENAEEITLHAPSLACYQTVIDSYLPLFEKVKEKLGLSFLLINIELALDSPQATKQENSLCKHETPSLETASVTEASSDNTTSTAPFSKTLSKIPKINKNYTFENYVRGPSNQFALATCLNVADNPGANYNPLFLYGSTGLGKTHLLHAVGNRAIAISPTTIVTYISSERFMNEMIYCIRHNKMWDFRQKYRHCDLFMMDDIQFISGNKSATQEEFFHTFNTLYEAKKQIIVTSDLFPQDIPDIEERLRNRFQWGLIADIQPPDAEHRAAILINKAESLGVTLTNDVAEYIANHAKRNVRELEGALHRTAAFAALHGRPLDITLAKETLQGMAAEQTKRVTADTIQRIVAEHFKLRIQDLKSKKRQRTLSVPRQIAMYLVRQYTRASYPDIGDSFGGKDHTTVMYAVKKITKQRETDSSLRMHLESIERQVEQM